MSKGHSTRKTIPLTPNQALRTKNHSEVNPGIQQMNIEEYAQLQSSLGKHIVNSGGIYWHRVRPCFYRTLLPYQAYDNGLKPPQLSMFGGFQHVVSSVGTSNSTMNFIMLDRLGDYSFDNLSHNRRRLIKAAKSCFVVKDVHDRNIIKNQGHQVYLSFFARTSYQFKKERVEISHYHRWIDAIFDSKNAFVQGGFFEDDLVAVSISYWVDRTIIYASFFSETTALNKGVGELMFHRLREIASHIPGMDNIFVRPYQGGNGMDEYYLKRGCHVLRQPAYLSLNPVTSLFLRSFLPKQYALLCGKF